MIPIKCKKCSYKWNYRGISKYYASCPMCRTVNKIKEEEGE